MKKYFFTLALFSILAFDTFAQASTSERYSYLDVMMKGKNIEVDFGQKSGRTIENQAEINARLEKVTSSTDVKNILDDFGWEFVNQQVIVTSLVTYYLYNFRKPFKK